MPCPVILVGPDRPDELWLNSKARPLAATLLTSDARWSEIPSAVRV